MRVQAVVVATLRDKSPFVDFNAWVIYRHHRRDPREHCVETCQWKSAAIGTLRICSEWFDGVEVSFHVWPVGNRGCSFPPETILSLLISTDNWPTNSLRTTHLPLNVDRIGPHEAGVRPPFEMHSRTVPALRDHVLIPAAVVSFFPFT